MQTYVHIVAESHGSSWTAWFSDAPLLTCEGCADWAHAVAALIDIHGSPDLEWKGIFALQTTTRDDHAEFLIPYTVGAQHPITTSAN